MANDCSWGFLSEMYTVYHGTEWGVPVHDDRVMFEHLSLECFQCGLSWTLMLKKREIFRACLDGFDFEKIARYTEEDVQRILDTEGMIRAPRKIRALISNARAALQIRDEFGSLCAYFWSYSEGRVIVYKGHPENGFPVSNGLSARISKDLRKRGFRFVGPVTVYSHLQACGIINDHGAACPCYQKILSSHPHVFLDADEEVY